MLALFIEQIQLVHLKVALEKASKRPYNVRTYKVLYIFSCGIYGNNIAFFFINSLVFISH